MASTWVSGCEVGHQPAALGAPNIKYWCGCNITQTLRSILGCKGFPVCLSKSFIDDLLPPPLIHTLRGLCPGINAHSIAVQCNWSMKGLVFSKWKRYSSMEKNGLCHQLIENHVWFDAKVRVRRRWRGRGREKKDMCINTNIWDTDKIVYCIEGTGVFRECII